MKIKYLIFAIIVILLISFVILYKNYKEDEVKGFTFEEIDINKNELKECCNYYDNNEIKTCSVIKRFDCSLCSAKCS